MTYTVVADVKIFKVHHEDTFEFKTEEEAISRLTQLTYTTMDLADMHKRTTGIDYTLEFKDLKDGNLVNCFSENGDLDIELTLQPTDTVE